MKRRRAASSGQTRSGRAVAGSFSSGNPGAGDAFDDAAPDDLPVRDVRDDEDEPRSTYEVAGESRAEPERHQADGLDLQAHGNSGTSEPVGAPSLSSIHIERVGGDLQPPGPLSEAEAGEPHSQHQLPGLELDATANQGDANRRAGRSKVRRNRLQKLALKAAQLELWSEADVPLPRE
jgi:hypothetical protein